MFVVGFSIRRALHLTITVQTELALALQATSTLGVASSNVAVFARLACEVVHRTNR
jgi:uncharacterized membrane protein (Fun14 family)